MKEKWSFSSEASLLVPMVETVGILRRVTVNCQTKLLNAVLLT